LKNSIFHIKLFHHFEFSRKNFFHKSFIFTQNIEKTKEKWTKILFLQILGEKYKYSRHHLEYRRYFDFSGLAANFLQ
jgi:hypothetical protein